MHHRHQYNRPWSYSNNPYRDTSGNTRIGQVKVRHHGSGLRIPRIAINKDKCTTYRHAPAMFHPRMFQGKMMKKMLVFRSFPPFVEVFKAPVYLSENCKRWKSLLDDFLIGSGEAFVVKFI